MPGTVEGKVVSVSEQGNLITDITPDQLDSAPRDESFVVVCDEHETQGLFELGHDQPESTFIAILGESGCLELEIVGLSAAMMLGIGVGETVTARW